MYTIRNLNGEDIFEIKKGSISYSQMFVTIHNDENKNAIIRLPYTSILYINELGMGNTVIKLIG